MRAAVRWCPVAAALIAGCGRLEFSLITSDPDGGSGDSGAAGDGGVDAAACGPFGTLRGERTFTGQNTVIVDPDRILVFADRILASVNAPSGQVMYELDHDLGTLNGPVAYVGVGNFSLAYNAVDDIIVGAAVGLSSGDLYAFSPTTFATLMGPVSTGLSISAGFADPTGRVHVGLRAGNGFNEYDSTLTLAGTWGSGSATSDAVLDVGRNRAWLASGSGVAAFDFGTSGRPLLFSFALPANAVANAITVDDNGTAYVTDRDNLRLYAVRDDTIVDMLQFTTLDPASIAYDGYTGRLLVGQYEGPGASRIQMLCPYTL